MLSVQCCFICGSGDGCDDDDYDNEDEKDENEDEVSTILLSVRLFPHVSRKTEQPLLRMYI